MGISLSHKLVLDLTDTTVEQESSSLVTPHAEWNVIEDDSNIFAYDLLVRSHCKKRHPWNQILQLPTVYGPPALPLSFHNCWDIFADDDLLFCSLHEMPSMDQPSPAASDST